MLENICAHLHSHSHRSYHKFYLLFPFLAAKIGMKASCLHVLERLLFYLLNFRFITLWLNILITFFYHIVSSPFLLPIYNTPNKQTKKTNTFFWVKNGQIGRIFNLYLEDQITNSDSLLLILVCIYFKGNLALSITMILK